MFDTSTWMTVVSLIFFPSYFQGPLLNFAWGAHDPEMIAMAKRIFILLPCCALIAACWATTVALISVIVRQNRREFITYLFVTWWDMGKCILSFWGGCFKFCMFAIHSVFLFSRLIVVGLLVFISDILSAPFKVVQVAGASAFGAGLPWIAILLTLGWTLLEATIFTFVTTGLVTDTLSSVSGMTISPRAIRFPLFGFMLFIVLGSYSVLLTLGDALKTRNVTTIVKIAVVEVIAMMVEVIFLYREFVDALVPWFAQHSGGNFSLGITGTLAIASFTWMGIRSMSWFLFAQAGTPVIMSVIGGRGFATKGAGGGKDISFDMKLKSIERMKTEMKWIIEYGDNFLGAFLFPPLQIVAATINFFVLVITSDHLFEIPFTDFKSIYTTRPSLRRVTGTSRGIFNDKKSA